MPGDNGTVVTHFILLGFPGSPATQAVLFMIFLLLYCMILLGNTGLIVLIKISPQLHTPMYYFLCNLSLVDICYSSVIVPQMLVNFLSEKKVISYVGCGMQFHFFCAFADTESYILASMAYDRYVAICNPLLYNAMMAPKICILLLTLCYFAGTMSGMVHTSFAFRLSYCGPNIINHFFCDLPLLLKLSCSDTSLNELLLFTYGTAMEILILAITIISYILIVFTILKMRSAAAMRKAFSTCTSHMISLIIYQGTILFIYSRPSSWYSPASDKYIAVFYTIIVPVLNPLVYSLRNKDVKAAFRKAIDNKGLERHCR